MVLPILIGAAVLAAGWGVKSAVEASSNSDKAKQTVDDATQRLENAKSNLIKQGELSQAQLESLARVRLETSFTALKRLVALANRVHTGSDDSKLATADKVTIPDMTLARLEEITLTAGDILQAGSSGLGTAALAGIGTVGLAQAVGTASTGAAISSLSGAAATNATWAWLGGGSIAAGGGGMVAGMMATGGLAVGVVALVAGMKAASAAEKKLTDATAFAAAADVDIQRMDVYRLKLLALVTRCRQVENVLLALRQRTEQKFSKMEAALDAISPGRVPFASLSDAEKSLYKTCILMGTTLYELVEINLSDDTEAIRVQGNEILSHAQSLLDLSPGGAA